MNEQKQTAKGDNITQLNLTVNGNYITGLDKEAVIDIIKSYGYVNIDEIIEVVQNAIEGINAEKRVMPDKRIFVPLIQQLSYSLDDETLKATYSKLLASSLNSEKKHALHPSFINIVSQLNSDEIKLLNSLPCSTHLPKPIINVRMKIGDEQGLGIMQVKYFTDIAFCVCERPDNICVYLENLERLQIIEIPKDKTITSKEAYLPLKSHPLILAVLDKNKSSDNLKIAYEYDEMFFRLTQFGVNFITCCKK